MKTKLFLFIALILVTSSSIYSQDDWESIPIDQWQQKHVKKILTDSPWVKTVVTQYSISNILNGEMKADVLLRSALPIRLALLRKKQLEKKYDKMNEAKKAEFDKNNSELLTCPACSKYFVISIISSDASLSSKFINDRKKFVYLENDNGEKRELVQFLSGSGNDSDEELFFFSRLNKDGKDFLDKSNKTFSFNLDLKVEDVRGYPVSKVSFNVSDITRENQIIF